MNFLKYLRKTKLEEFVLEFPLVYSNYYFKLQTILSNFQTFKLIIKIDLSRKNMVSKLGVLLETHFMKYIHIACRLISHNKGWAKLVILSYFMNCLSM